MKKLFAMLLVLALALSLCACGSGGNEPQMDPQESQQQTMEPEQDPTAGTEPASEPDLSNPTIIVEYGDREGLKKVMDDMSLSRVEENTVIRITGELFRVASWCVGFKEENSDGRTGIVMVLDDDGPLPEEYSKVEVTGVAVKGEWYTEFHVKTENIKPVE